MKYFKFSFKNSVLIAILAFLSAGNALASGSYYVADQLVITLRSGQGDQYRIIKTLRSGEKVEMLEDAGEHARVRAADGTEGWARKQYLQQQPTSKVQLDALERKYAALQETSQRIEKELNELKEKHDALQKEHDRLARDNKGLRKENIHLNQVAAQPLEFERQNQLLLTESTRVKQENELLEASNAEYRESTAQKWFLAGAAVLLIGILAGLLLPTIRKKRASAW